MIAEAFSSGVFGIAMRGGVAFRGHAKRVGFISATLGSPMIFAVVRRGTSARNVNSAGLGMGDTRLVRNGICNGRSIDGAVSKSCSAGCDDTSLNSPRTGEKRSVVVRCALRRPRGVNCIHLVRHSGGSGGSLFTDKNISILGRNRAA